MDLDLAMDGTNTTFKIRLGSGGWRLPLPGGLLTRMGNRIRKKNLNTLKGALEGLRTFVQLSGSLLQRIELIQIRIQFSLGDPFWTSLSCGVVWASVGGLCAALAETHKLEQAPDVLVQPDYGDAKFQAKLHCIFHFRLGQIIINQFKRATYVAKGAEQ